MEIEDITALGCLLKADTPLTVASCSGKEPRNPWQRSRSHPKWLRCGRAGGSGPRGGLSDVEAAAAAAAGFWVVKLGPRILRAETAAVAACAIVQYLFGDLGSGQKNLDKKLPTE